MVRLSKNSWRKEPVVIGVKYRKRLINCTSRRCQYTNHRYDEMSNDHVTALGNSCCLDSIRICLILFSVHPKKPVRNRGRSALIRNEPYMSCSSSFWDFFTAPWRIPSIQKTCDSLQEYTMPTLMWTNVVDVFKTLSTRFADEREVAAPNGGTLFCMKKRARFITAYWT